MSEPAAKIDYTPDVLSNRGVPVPLYELDEEGNPRYGPEGPIITVEYLRFTSRALVQIEADFRGYTVERTAPERKTQTTIASGADGKPSLQPRVEWTGKTVREPTIYYGMEALEQALQIEPWSTLVKTFSIAFNRDVTKMGAQLLTQQQSTYVASLNVALSLANGVDPTMAAEAMSVSLEAAAAVLEMQNSEMQRMGVEAQKTIREAKKKAAAAKKATKRRSPRGTPGSGAGSRQTAKSKSSGS